MNFEVFQSAVSKQFSAMAVHDLFRTAVTGDEMWAHYLQSFPVGSNPMLRKRTEHDCSCCRHFIKTVGNVVAIIDGAVVSIWDAVGDAAEYAPVALAMSNLVRASPIENVFLHYDRTVGVRKNHQQDGEKVLTWNHFCVEIPNRNERPLICKKADIPTKLGEERANYEVLMRSLLEISSDSVSTVLELMDQNNLYRGAEYRSTLEAFNQIQHAFRAIDGPLKGEKARARVNYVWSRLSSSHASLARIRNTAIGTLLVDLSEGADMEKAVKSYEAKVAPANFKRPTALVTQSMVDAAKKAIDELGFTSAMDRRYASLADVSVNNVIFADRRARSFMKDSLFDGIATKPPSRKNVDGLESVDIDTFVKDVVPRANSIEMMFENKHAGNLMSLIAPVHADAANFFKWENRFSWSYNGDVADSIKERVKRAGGSVTGEFCCRLAWYNFDDLDFHMGEVIRGQRASNEIFFGNRGPSPSYGRLDVDMNAGSGHTREPVENIFYPRIDRMKDGVYSLFVHQFSRRESDNVGFDVEVDILGEVHSFSYAKPVKDNVPVANFEVKSGKITMMPILSSATASRSLWGIKTNEFHRVNAMMFSPNYWDHQRGIGNQHYFFMLDGCKNEGQARPFFNEFLRADLDKHRKVMEIVGARAKVAPSEDQLSGLGFSSTVRNEIVVKVDGEMKRTMKVTF